MPWDPTPLGLLIIAARQSLRNAIGQYARPHGLTTKQFWVLVTVHRYPGIAPGAVGESLLLDPPAASRLIASLAERGLVEARPDRDDRRRTQLFLTADGARMAPDLSAIADAYFAATLKGFSPEEVALLREGLLRVVENLAEFEVGALDRAPPPADRAARPRVAGE